MAPTGWMRRLRRSPSVVAIAAAAVAIGLLPMPYEYYVLLRFLLCGVAIWLLSQADGLSEAARITLVALAILFNPIVPIELGGGTVAAVAHVATVTYFWLVQRRISQTSW